MFAETDVADNPVERIYKLKREVLEMNAATSPLLEPLELLSQSTTSLGSGRDAHVLP